MILIQRIKKLFKERITIMVIPGSQGEIKQVKLFKAMVFSVIFFCLSLGLFLTTFSIIMITNNAYLTQMNKSYANELLYKADALDQLSNVVDTKKQEVKALTDQVNLTADYYDNKLVELTALEKRVGTLISLLDAPSGSSLINPISRSGDLISRTAPNVPSSIEDIQTLNAPDEITELISAQMTLYDEMISDVEETLAFMDCKPDYKPAEGKFSSGFGPRRDPVYGRLSYHRGIDLANKKGTPIYAAGTGVVTFSEWNNSYGNVIAISHGYGYKTVYAHLTDSTVKVGDKVEKGDLIATMGSTGKSTGTHLHFEVHFEGIQIDPMKVLSSKGE